MILIEDNALGNSGGPVFHVKDGGERDVIGIHCYGDQLAGVNKATLLGYHGNEPDLFRDILTEMEGTEAASRLKVEEVPLTRGTLEPLEGQRIWIPNRWQR